MQDYRPDIDGLRAVAVLPVVLFHMGAPQLSGGFVGVDVFFVISGYLITRIIWRELQQQRFSLRRFYERRARRILPVLFTVLLLTGLAGLALLSPVELLDLGVTMLGALFFVSNFVLYAQVDYFANLAHAKPLLHTWSLAVEEQFYIFFPLILGAVLRYFGTRWVRVLLWVSLLLSLGLTLLILPRAADFAFYATPLRAWELLCGAALALLNVPRARGWVSHALSLAGLAAILLPVALYDSGTAFPGLSALPPVLGATALIWAGPASVGGRLLSWRPLVLIGLISYSLYMWHWPVLVLIQLAVVRPLTPVELTGVLALILALSWLSWRFVEGPFRHRELVRTQGQVLRLSLAGFAVVAAVSGLFVGLHGLPGRGSATAQTIARVGAEKTLQPEICAFDTPLWNGRGICKIGAEGPPQIMIWGDSHAAAWYPGFDQILRDRGIAGRSVALYGCPPALGFTSQQRGDSCPRLSQRVFDDIRDQGIRQVLIVGYWRSAILSNTTLYKGRLAEDADSRRQNIIDAVSQTIDTFHANGIQVAFLMPVPGALYPVPDAMYRQDRLGGRTELRRETAEYLSLIEPLQAATTKADLVLRIDDQLCDATHCAVAQDGIPLYYDGNHPSSQMNRMLRPQLEAQLAPFLEAGRP